MTQTTPQDTAEPAESPQPPAPADLRTRHADNLRRSVSRSQMAYATRARANQAIDRYEQTPGPTAATGEAVMLDRLIEIGEICCQAGSANRTLGDAWAVNAIERMLQKNPDL